MNDYGEPWSDEGFITNRDGVDIDGTRQCDKRAVACANSLAGIPDSWLEGRAAAKVLLEKKLDREWGVSLAFAIEQRGSGKSFGELNELIDSFKEEM